ncbi:hypothetical protein [Phytomonospora endophytica]|uniref:Uncharacterized protein n=1 Tax=Phytomonospora endophytica TaxID=714109 RepID=A0A841FNV0_9ACTN|nr:hypothetical protein [Phytomonospora endophytica]MBB6035232.1 hypothetical protein [Phytomonospora endophytica]GIG64018.1 hypothetical protein Pen01_03130 [Phytomonospora endophytica]
MTSEQLAQMIVAALGLAGTVVTVVRGQRGEDRFRRRVRYDVELYKDLPEGSGESAAKLLHSINVRLERIAEQAERRRQPPGMALVVFLLVALTIGAVVMIGSGAFFVAVLVFPVFVFVAGMAWFGLDGMRRTREERGRARARRGGG